MLTKKSDGINMNEIDNQTNQPVILVERNDNVLSSKKLKQACLSFVSTSPKVTPLNKNKRKISSNEDVNTKCKLTKVNENNSDLMVREGDSDEINSVENNILNVSNQSSDSERSNKRSQEILKRFLLTPAKDLNAKPSDKRLCINTKINDSASCGKSVSNSEQNKLPTFDDTNTVKENVENKLVKSCHVICFKMKENESSTDEKISDCSFEEHKNSNAECTDKTNNDAIMIEEPNANTNEVVTNKDMKKTKVQVKRKKSERDASRAKHIQEKEEKKKEKEKLKEEKQKKLAEKLKLREERLMKKQEEREEKRKLKAEALAKKKELQEQREQERLQKEEEKKRKFELLEAKQEKRRKSELEKSLREEEEARKKEKVKAVFASFFVKKDKEDSPTRSESHQGLFKPFQIKKNMRLAPISRVEVSNKLRSTIDERLAAQDCGCLYLEELHNKIHVRRGSDRTWPLDDDDDDDDDVQMTNENEVIMEAKIKHLHPKLLLFHENTRPPYWGTWRKKSRAVRPRNPFVKDENFFDYEVDSDEEWEEEEPGESLSASEDEKESEDEYEVDNDFFVPHGYLSEDEEIEDEDAEIKRSPTIQKAKLKLKEREFEEEMKTKCKQIKPRVFGCFWSTRRKGFDDILNILEAYSAVPLVSVPIAVRYITKDSVNNSDPSPKKTEDNLAGGPVKQPVPEEAMPFLIRLLHGNSKGISTIMNEFQEFWKKHTFEMYSSNTNAKESDKSDELNSNIDSSTEPVAGIISKRQLKLTIKKISKRDVWPEETTAKTTSKMWYVSSEVREKYKLSDLSIPNQWNYITIILKPVKNAKKISLDDGKNFAVSPNASLILTDMQENIADPSNSVTPSLKMDKETSASPTVKPQKTCKNNMSISKFLLPRNTSPEQSMKTAMAAPSENKSINTTVEPIFKPPFLQQSCANNNNENKNVIIID